MKCIFYRGSSRKKRDVMSAVFGRLNNGSWQFAFFNDDTNSPVKASAKIEKKGNVFKICQLCVE